MFKALTIDILIWLALFAIVKRAFPHPRLARKAFVYSLFFVQLFIVLLLVPPQPDGIRIHLDRVSFEQVTACQVTKQGEILHASAIKKKILKREGDASVVLDFGEFRLDRPHVAFRFGEIPARFRIDGLTFYEKILGYRLPVIQVPGGDTGLFLVAPNPAINSLVPQGSFIESIPQSETEASWIVLKRGKGMLRFRHFRGVFYRALAFSALVGLVLLCAHGAHALLKLAMRHASRKERSLKSAMAYGAVSFCALLLVLAILLGTLEFGVRFWYRDVLSTASGDTYFSNRSKKSFLGEHNPQGYRGRPFSIPKTPGTLRVVVMGDSLSYGQGVHPYTLRFTERVETILKTRHGDSPIEIINLGVCGRDLPHYLKFLPTVFSLHPDLILYQWFINDMDTQFAVSQIAAPPFLSNWRTHKWWLNRSALYFLVQKAWNKTFLVRGKIKPYNRYFVDRMYDEKSEYAQKADASFAALLAQLGASGTPHAVVLFPHHAFKVNGYPFAFMHERVSRKCRENRVPCLDLLPAFAPYDSRLESLWANRLDPHPGALAHEIAANRIAAFLEPILNSLCTFADSHRK